MSQKIRTAVTLKAIKLVSNAIRALSLANMDLLVRKPPIFYTIKDHGYIKSNSAVGRTGYKWKTADT
jgi:hypothetical protein